MANLPLSVSQNILLTVNEQYTNWPWQAAKTGMNLLKCQQNPPCFEVNGTQNSFLQDRCGRCSGSGWNRMRNKKITVTLSETEANRLERLATHRKVSLNEIVRESLALNDAITDLLKDDGKLFARTKQDDVRELLLVR